MGFSMKTLMTSYLKLSFIFLWFNIMLEMYKYFLAWTDGFAHCCVTFWICKSVHCFYEIMLIHL